MKQEPDLLKLYLLNEKLFLSVIFHLTYIWLDNVSLKSEGMVFKCYLSKSSCRNEHYHTNMQIVSLLSIAKTYLPCASKSWSYHSFLICGVLPSVQLENVLSFGSSLANSACLIQSDHFSISQTGMRSVFTTHYVHRFEQ